MTLPLSEDPSGSDSDANILLCHRNDQYVLNNQSNRDEFLGTHCCSPCWAFSWRFLRSPSTYRPIAALPTSTRWSNRPTPMLK